MKFSGQLAGRWYSDHPGKCSYPGRLDSLARLDMNKNSILIQKITAVLMILIGLLAMLVAWELLLVSNIHNSTVMVLEMGGVALCMAGVLLRRRAKAAERESNSE